MIILGIETSCDETAASVVQDGRKVLSHVLATSADMHTKTGGIIPEVAAREQLRSIIPIIEEALVKAFEVGSEKWECRQGGGKLDKKKSHISPLPFNIDAIAVTYGPGLIGSLLVGVETAKTLSFVWNKPLVPVNHLVGHIYANFINETQNSNVKSQSYNLKFKTNKPEFPALALVVSGGHTDLVLMKNHGKVQWIGGTRDDAAGEAFDKTARLLGLPYPGGPSIAKAAMEYQISNDKLQMFPRPMLDEDNYDWSFSGLKTAVLRETEKQKNLKTERPRLAAQIQEAIVDVLVGKTMHAVKKFKPKSLLLGGGVAANKRLVEKFENEILNLDFDLNFLVPSPKLCTDNASMIAAAAYYNYHPVPWQKINVVPGLTIIGET